MAPDVAEASKAPGGKPWATILKDNFAAILSMIVAAITGGLGYLFVTSVNHQLAVSKLNFEQFAEREKLALSQRRAELDAHKESLGNSKIIEDYVPKLLNSDPHEVENGSITLAAAGAANTHILAAALGNAKQVNPEQIIVGLRISAARNHAETCEALSRYGKQLLPDPGDSTSAGNIAKALGDLRCVSAIALLGLWRSRLSNDNIGDALKRLCTDQPKTNECADGRS